MGKTWTKAGERNKYVIMKIILCLIFAVLILVFSKSGFTESAIIQISNDLSYDSVDQKKIDLVETVLNLPKVIKFSKVEQLRNNHKTIYIYFDRNEFKSIPMIVQEGRRLTVLKKLDSLNNEKVACYRFRIKLNHTTAVVQLSMEVTGAIAYGNLNYIDGHWEPDKNFVVGVK
jgi:hypothetical protein